MFRLATAVVCMSVLSAGGQVCSVSESDSFDFADTSPNDHFGFSVDHDKTTAVVGAFGIDDTGDNSGAAYVLTKVQGQWRTIARLVPDDPASNDYFGNAVAIDTDSQTIVVGAPFKGGLGSGGGAVYVFTYTASIGTWTQQAKLVASDTAANDFFGFSVAVDNDRVVVGAYGDDDTAAGTGSVYVFDRLGTTWSETTKLTRAAAEEGDELGFDVGVSGPLVAAGARSANSPAFNAGAVVLFRDTGGVWSEEGTLAAADQASGDRLGTSVSIDGNRILAGAPFDGDAGASSGSAYVFDFDGSSWSQSQKLVAPDAAAGDLLGFSVSLDGNLAAAGAKLAGNDGAAYVFRYSGAAWSPDPTLTDSDAVAAEDFGAAVSVDEFEQTLLVGADLGFVDAIKSGTMHGFDYELGSWGADPPVYASFADPYDGIGNAVALTDVAGVTHAIVGSPGDDEIYAGGGAAYLFRQTPAGWTLADKATPLGGVSWLGQFGDAIDADGDRVIVGAPNSDTTLDDAGAAFIYQIVGNELTQAGSLMPNFPAAGQRLGFSVSVAGDWALAGAPGDNQAGTSAGAAFVFRRSGSSWVEDIKLLAPGGQALDSFGWNAKLIDDSNAFVRGGQNVYWFQRGAGWTYQSTFTGQGPSDPDGFGASIDGDAARLIIGAPGDDNTNGNAAGAVYVFRWNGAAWLQDQVLVAPDGAANDLYGLSVSQDGSWLVVGSDQHNGGTGRAYVYEDTGAQFEFRVALERSAPAPLDFLGRSVSLLGATALVGSTEGGNIPPRTGTALTYDLGAIFCPPACVADATTTNTNPGDPGFGSPDGVVDGADLSYYVENWLGVNPAVADVQTTNTNPGDAAYGVPDGTVDGADLSYFVEQWLAGCP